MRGIQNMSTGWLACYWQCVQVVFELPVSSLTAIGYVDVNEDYCLLGCDTCFFKMSVLKHDVISHKAII
jgi:hypothetical protein